MSINKAADDEGQVHLCIYLKENSGKIPIHLLSKSEFISNHWRNEKKKSCLEMWRFHYCDMF